MNSVTYHTRFRTLGQTLMGLVLFALLAAVPARAQVDVGFSAASTTVTEGNSVTITVRTYDAALAQDATVDYQVGVPGSCTAVATANLATAGDDFVVASGTLSFASGSAAGTTKTFSVTTVEDSIRENPQDPKASSECFEVSLSNFSAGFSGLEAGFDDIDITITDDEDDAQLSIADATAAENGGNASMTVSLTVPIDEDLDLATLAATYTDITTEGAADFTAASDAGTLTAGSTSGTLSVPIVNDAVYEGDEDVNVTISANAAFDLADGVGKLTIQDDEGVPEVSIDDVAATEGSPIAFTLTASHDAEATYNVTLSYSDITATSGTDYTPDLSVVMSDHTAPFTGTATVATAGDTDVEGTENFIVTVEDGADYDPDAGNDNGLGTINDNDGIDIAVTLDISDTTIDLDGTPATTVTVVLTNNGVETPGTDLTLAFSDVGFAMAGATFTSYTGDNGNSTTCDTDATLQTGTCVVEDTDFTSGQSETLVFTISADGAAGSTASLTVTESGNTETDDSNNSDSDSALLVGLDYGDNFAGAIAAGGTHRMSSDLKLGSVVSAETTNNGANNAADDDGVTILGNIVVSTTAYFGVTVSGGDGYLSVLGSDADVTDRTDVPVSEGLNWVGIAISGTATTEVIRFRLCSAAGDCDEDDEAADDGEMEDYTFTAAAAPTTVTLPSGTAEPVTVSEDASGDLVLTDGNGNVMFEQAYTSGNAGTTNFTVTGNSDPNTLVLDLASVDAGFDLAYDGGTGSDALEIVDSGAGTWTFAHTAANATDGAIVMGATAIGVGYTNLAPILASVTLTTATFTFSDAIDDDIVLRDNGSSTDGLSFIDSNGSEAITFTTPTTSITVNAGDGDDTIDYQGVDETGTPSTTITFDGEEGSDTFMILPVANSSSLSLGTVAGGTPTTCPGDVLDIVTTGGAVIDTITSTAGAGTISFTSAHKTVSFTGMEAFADQSADVSLAMSSSGGTTVNPGDVLTITLTVANAGPDTASCIQVDDILFGSDGASGTVLSINSGPTFSTGSYNATTGVWTIGSMASGDSATITYTATVNAIFNGTATATAASAESDPDDSDNSVSLTVNPAFAFPEKAQATAAEWFGSGANEHLVVGLANGFSGLSSSVLCRVPSAIQNSGTGFPENRWRECGDGLPYPLYVNDLYLDDQGTPADSSDDRLYLASWGSAGLYVSDDGGENFTAAEPVLGPKGGWANVYAILEDNSGFLYISANNGLVFRSLNNGSTWQQVGSLPGVASDTPWSMASHPTEAGRLYAGTFGNGIFTSDDFGFTWSELGGEAVNDLLIADDGGHAFDLELLPSSNATSGFIFAATGGGVFRMALDGDGDSSGLWSMIDTDVTLDSGTVTPEARALAFDADEDLYVTTWGHGAFFSSGPSVATSMTQIALRGANVAFVAISPDGTEVLFGTEGSGLVFTPAASISTDTEPEGTEVEIPSGYVLNQNYPNPFNPVTTISFALPQTGQARLAVYDVLGREVQLLVQGTVQAGQHEVQFDAAGLPTGTYIYRLETEKGSFAKQLVLMK